MQQCKSIMPKIFLQGMTNNVRFTFGVGDKSNCLQSIHPNLQNCHPPKCHSLSYIHKPNRTYMLNLNLPHCCHMSLPYITSFDIRIIHQRIQTTCSHAPHCHHCNVDFVLFHNVTLH